MYQGRIVQCGLVLSIVQSYHDIRVSSFQNRKHMPRLLFLDVDHGRWYEHLLALTLNIHEAPLMGRQGFLCKASP